jgi:hypothetical protein
MSALVVARRHQQRSWPEKILNTDIAGTGRGPRSTVDRWRAHNAHAALADLVDEDRLGRPTTIDQRQIVLPDIDYVRVDQALPTRQGLPGGTTARSSLEPRPGVVVDLRNPGYRCDDQSGLDQGGR